ncbi:HDOD domain-containing protein [bacterium]|nr:HDOD domain-containing protein [bacterium]
MPVPSSPESLPERDPAPTAASQSALELREFVEAIADTIEHQDPAVAEVRAALDARIAEQDIELPRNPDTAAKILSLAKTSEASMQDVLRYVRTDAALAGRILEMANSAAYAGAQKVYSLKMAVVRLGLTKVGEVAFEMSGGSKNFQKDKRSNMLSRMWKYSLAVGFVCEELASRVPGQPADSCFLTGLFHNVASSLIVESVGRLERLGAIGPQSESRVLGLVNALTGEYTVKVLKAWNIPKDSMEAIRLQDAKAKERRKKPLAHLLVCSKAIAAELGMGVRPQALDFAACRDFKFLGLDDDAKLEPAREAAVEKMIQVARR